MLPYGYTQIQDDAQSVNRPYETNGAYTNHSYQRLGEPTTATTDGIYHEPKLYSTYACTTASRTSGDAETAYDEAQDDTHLSAYWMGENQKQGPQPPLYAPVPISGCATFSGCTSLRSADTYTLDGTFTDSQYATPSNKTSPGEPFALRSFSYAEHPGDDFGFSQSHTSLHPTFPTPSELLVELAGQDSRAMPESPRRHRDRIGCSLRHPFTDVVASGLAESESSFFTPPLADVNNDSITSHEKKRYYLECLEQYVRYLHQHCRINGLETGRIERVIAHRGLSSRSIRCLLVHMEKVTAQYKQIIQKEEQRFLYLREAVQSGTNQGFQSQQLSWKGIDL